MSAQRSIANRTEQRWAGPVAAGGGAAVLASAVACDAVRVGTYTTRIFVHCVYIVSARCRLMVVI